MGSKKGKKKKLKCKKAQKLRKIKVMKLKKTIKNEFNKKETFQNPDQMVYCKKYSRSCIGEKYISKVKNFSKIREHYFSYLQTVVSDNCLYYNSLVTEEILENLSLQLEQHAILACLEADIYEKSMTKIISDIKKSSEGKQMHTEIKKLLPQSQSEDNSEKTENVEKTVPESECYSTIPTISSTRTDNALNYNINEWTDPVVYNPETVDSYYSGVVNYQEQYSELHSANQVVTNTQPWSGDGSLTIDNSDYWNNEIQTPQTNTNSYGEIQNSVMVNQSSTIVQTNQNVSDQNTKVKPISRVPPQTNTETDPLLASRNRLQKTIEQTFKHSDKLLKQRKDEKERALIAQILEGEDSSGDRFYDSLSDNENEAKENIDESNLMDRLEKMRELFGVENEDSKVAVIMEKPKPQKTGQISSRGRRPTIWKHEKVIQLHKFSRLSLEMTFERRQTNRELFLELFGEDSDEEHENEYLSEEKYRTSCTERISSWVVKYLMPFYHDKRIIGRNVFKTLGHHVSDSIVDKIQYPDEWTVKYLVSKFFPHRKTYVCDADVLAFQLD